jgi:hypothetical protein
MKVTGFSFIKNAIKFQYPVVEAIQSVLPLCDEFIIAVGDSDDGTRDLIASIDPKKIRIIDTVWDEHFKKEGRTLALETDKAFRAIGDDTDWCFYIQGDEVLHEQYYDEVYQQLIKWKEAKEVDGLLFKYRHFYGSYDYVGISSTWYRNEIRIIKNDKSIYSYRDAQGFRKGNNEKLLVKPINAYIHHYGWVREPKAMFAKQTNFRRFYHDDGNKEMNYVGEVDYTKIDALKKYTGTHPKVMQSKIASINWQFDYDISYNKISLKDRFKNLLEKLTGKRPFDFNNYEII